jgi:serine/threonine-protein kinase
MIGQTISHYRILEKLGSGGMGVVYKAEDINLGRTVAIKLLGERLKGEEAARAQLLREARTASRLNHAHICTIHEVGETTDQTYIVMECLEGRLLSALARPGGLPAELVTRYGAQIAEALAHAHERSVIHRDLKTANIIITTDHRAKILDFGLAIRIARTVPGDATYTLEPVELGAVAGTPHYLAPEILRGLPCDQRSDIWALGVVVYEMASGQMPFRGATQTELLAAILTKPPVPLPSLVPARLRAIIEHCLKKEPAERYQQALEVRVALEGLASGKPRARSTSPRPLRIHSVAVLPLADLSHDDEQAYFADGMTEALITDLAKIGALKVISRTSAMRYKGSTKPLPEIAHELGVDAIVEGSVLRTGGQVRITAQLVHAASDTHIWAESYDRDLTNVLSLQSEVAQAIAHAVEVKLTPEEKKRLTGRPVINPAAHELYLKGRYFWNQRGSGLRKALDFFQRALIEEPGYASAHAGLADAYALLGFYGYAVPTDVMPRAKEVALKALTLDPNLAEAHALLGYVHTIFDWKWQEAEKEFQIAFKLNRTYSPTCCWRAILLFTVGTWEQAVDELKRGLEYDPVSAYLEAHLGIISCFAGQWALATEHCSKALDLDANFLVARCALALAYYFQSHAERAIRELERAVEASGRDPWPLSYLASVYAASGAHNKAQHLLIELEQRRKREYISATNLAGIYFQLRKLDQGFECLETACQERAPQCSWIHRNPLIATPGARSDPRFARMMDRIGLRDDT